MKFLQRILPPLSCVLLLALGGCGGSAGATGPKATATAKTVRTATAVTVATSVPTVTAQPTATRTPTSRPSPTPTRRARTNPTVASGPPGVVSASVSPATVAARGLIHLTVITSGAVSRAQLYIGSGLPSAPPPVAYTLIRTAPGIWIGTGTAPSIGGQYHFTVGLFDASGRIIHKDNDGWNIVVRGGGPNKGAGAQPLPVDIPLAPPFSYGNPIPAVFSALGKSISGSEVISSVLPKVSASSVTQFYETRLPRAGWSTSAGPAPGATSFTISGTKPGNGGTRVCIVEFSAGTLHIFYGTG